MYSLQGGRLLGSGTYGCVFDPPLLCDGKSLQREHLGKITGKVDYEIEERARQVLAPLKLPYFLVADKGSACLPAQKQKEKDLGKCKLLETAEPGSMVQFTMPQGGKDLFHRLVDNEIHDFGNVLLQLLEAGAYLVAVKFVHFDISTSNIVMNRKGQISLIDFGMSFTADAINEDTLKLRWKSFNPQYDAQPPEIDIMTGMTSGELNFDQSIYAYMKGKPCLRLAETILGLRVAKQESDLRHFCNTSRAFKNKDWLQVWRLYWPVFDSWAIGVVLLNILRTLLFKKSFVTSAFWRKSGGLVKSILRGLLQTNPRKRLDCIEALKLYDPENGFFEKYGNSWIESRAAQRGV